MALKDVALSDRPREKATVYGIETLSDVELLALLVETGVKGESVLTLCSKLVEKCGGLYPLSRADLHELMGPGLKKAKALKVMAAFELGKRALSSTNSEQTITSAVSVYQKYGPVFKTLTIEKAAVLSLDSQKRPLKICYIGQGTGNFCNSDLKLTLEAAIRSRATFIVLIHNHPEGRAQPSKADDMTTALLAETAALLGLRLLDHIIIGEDGYFSYSEQDSPILSARSTKVDKSRY